MRWLDAFREGLRERVHVWLVGRKSGRISLIARDSGNAPDARIYPTVHDNAKQNYPNPTHCRSRASPSRRVAW
jgi:hypothetical protein